jgi:hypothetical protein
VVTVRANWNILRQRVAKLINASDGATNLATRAIARMVADSLQRTPVDTARTLRAFSMASNDLGLGPYPVPSLQPSRHYERVLKRLAKQLSRWEAFDRWAREHGQTETKNYRRYVLPNLQRARQAWNDYRAAIGQDAVVMMNKGRAVEFTVRLKTFGGEGRVVRDGKGGVALYRWINKEPHARTVEAKFGTVRHALARARAAGGKTAKKSFLRGLPTALRMPA